MNNWYIMGWSSPIFVIAQKPWPVGMNGNWVPSRKRGPWKFQSFRPIPGVGPICGERV